MIHENYELIEAKLKNMNLVVLVKYKNREWTTRPDQRDVNFTMDSKRYWLCLPQHTDMCLKWLNGATLEIKDDFTEKWLPFKKENRSWSHHSLFMLQLNTSNIRFEKQLEDGQWYKVINKANKGVRVKIYNAKHDLLMNVYDQDDNDSPCPYGSPVSKFEVVCKMNEDTDS